MTMDVEGLMLSVPFDALRMPRFWVCTALYSVQKCPEVNGIIFHDRKIITGGVNRGSYEPITGSVKFDVYMSCHHSLGATGATLNTRNASS